MGFDFRQELIVDDEIDEAAADSYVEELSERFAESPEGAALVANGVVPGEYLDLFLDYALRYVGVNPAEMDARDVRETLQVMAEKVTAKPQDLDRAIPELEAFCGFVGRAFGFEKAAAWKRAIQDYAPEFRRAIRDPRHWGMAKSLMMEGLARGYDLSTEEGINRWFLTKQAEQIAQIEAETGSAPGGGRSLWSRLRQIMGHRVPDSAPGASEQSTVPLATGDLGAGERDVSPPGPRSSSKRRHKKEKSRRKLAKASRHRNRR